MRLRLKYRKLTADSLGRYVKFPAKSEYIEEYINDYDLFYDKELSGEKFEQYINNISPLIGKIIISFNNLDDTVNYVIKEIVSDPNYKDEIPWIFISEMSYNNKINVLKKLINFFLRFSEKDYENDFNNLINRLSECGRKRNYIVHANWMEINSDLLVKIKTKIKKDGAKNLYKVIKKENLIEIENYIDETNDILDNFFEDYLTF